MKDLIKKILRENLEGKILAGCDNFPKGTNDHNWCIFAQRNLNLSMKKVKDSVEKYKRDVLTDQGKIKKAKYDKDHIFFTDRRGDVLDAMKIFKKDCPSLRNYIYDRMVDFTKSFVILDEKNNYHLLNKLNTNWSAVAYIMTKELPEDLKTVNWKMAYNYFFDIKEGGSSPFESFLEKSLKSDEKDTLSKAMKTIEITSREGQKIEDEFYNYVGKYTEVKQYAGEYSFMDMIGVDMIIKNPEGLWIPVQVKKYSGGCDGKKYYRDHMCENWCVSWEKNYWRIKTYRGGGEPVKIKEQPKNEPLNRISFLNWHEDDSPKKNVDKKQDREIGDLDLI